MSRDGSSDDRDPMERLAEEFVARHRRGERPSPDEYAERYPQWADRIHALFMALLLLEHLKPGVGDPSDSPEEAGTRAAPSERLGDYRIIREVGRGGMGVVYEAEQESLGRHVALKVLPGSARLDPKLRERFRREARAAARLHHTNIVPVFGVGEDDDCHYYVMQLIQGRGLDEVLRELRRLRDRARAGKGDPGGSRGGASAATEASSAPPLSLVVRSLLGGDFEPRPADAGPPLPAASDTPSPALGREADSDADREPALTRALAGGPPSTAPEPGGGGGHTPFPRDAPSTLTRSRRVDAACDRFEAAWRAGEQPRIDDFLAEADGPERPLLLHELRLLEQELRRRRDARPGPGAPGAGRGAPPAGSGLSPTTPLRPAEAAPEDGAYPKAYYWRDVARIGRQVAEALHYAHTRGTLHRDIKPSNLLLDLQGTVWVTDFGLAKAADEADLTRTGDLVGTLRYMAPERFRGTSDPRSDIYGLGMTLYELLTLGPAFVETDRERLIHQITQSEPPRPSQLNPEVPRDLETICLKAIDREPAHRYQTAGALAEDLQRFLEDRPIRARRASPGERAGRWCRRNPALAGVTALAAALLIAVAAISSIGYIRTSAALAREETHLYHSLVGEARALRMARQDGYRRQAWDRLGRALRLPTRDRDLGELRREAVACLGDFVGLDPAVLDGFPAPIASLALHPGAEQVAIGLRDGGIYVRRLPDGAPIAVLGGPASAAIDLAYGPEGRSLMALHADGSLRLCTPDPDHGWVCSRTIKVGEETAPPLAAPGPRRLVFVRRDGGLMLRDLAAGTMIRLETGEADTFNTLADSFNTPYAGRLGPRSDCRFAALPYFRGGANEGEPYGILVWDVATGRELRRLASPIGQGYDVGFSPDLRLMACGCDGGLLVYELPSFGQRSVVRWDTVQKVRFSPDSQYLAAATISGLVKIWSVATNRDSPALTQSGDGNSYGLAISDDGRALALSGERKVRVWDLAGTPERRATAGHSGGVTSVAFSPDGTRLVSTSKDRIVRIWDPVTGRLCRTLSGYSHNIEAAAFAPDGRLLATGDWGGRLRLWDTQSWAEREAPEGRELEQIHSVAFDPKRDYLAASGEAGMMIWRLSPGERSGEDRPRPAFERLAWVPEYSSQCVAFSPDGGLVAFVGQRKMVRLWDVANGREVPFGGPPLLHGFKSLSFRPEGRQLAFVTSRGVGEVWDLANGARVLSLGGDGAFASQISSVSPGGRWFAGESTPAGVSLWDLGRGELAFGLREERSPVWSHAWSPDERRLALGLADGGLCIWDLREVLSRLDELGLGWR